MRTANCPSCGAPVRFRSAASFHAVCEFCRSTLVRHGDALENLGRMAELLEDASPLQLGTEGVYRGVHFAIVGRIQLRYASGVWNEWYLLFDDSRGGWLSDANGEYLLSFLTPPAAPLPAFDALQPGQRLSLGRREFAVSDIEQALCLAGEGELPFAFGAGYAAPLADLREVLPEKAAAKKTAAKLPSAAFATLDYSESPPLLFVGEVLPFDSFRFTQLRAGAAEKSAGPVSALHCPQCGGAIEIHDKTIQSVACPSCLTVLAPENAGLKILAKAKAATKIEPLLALGSVGTFYDKPWTVIGFQQRAIVTEGAEYPWREYLLHHAEEGFRWLTESDGHWSWVKSLSTAPRYQAGKFSLRHRGVELRRFSAGMARTDYVIGEFYWQVKVGETWAVAEYVAAPLLLSREEGDKEVTWSESEYLTPQAVVEAFGLKTPLPEPQGVAANQPNPRAEEHGKICKRFWLWFALASAVQLLWIFVLGGNTLLDQRVVFSPERQELITTPSFRLDKPVRSLQLTHTTDLDNNWIGMDLNLVEKNSGKAWLVQSEIAYWHGVDEGESWSEGSRERELVFHDLPAGDYYLAIDPEVSKEKPVSVVDRIRIVRDQAAWSSYFILLIFLSMFPLISRVRMSAFESQRWENADFLPTGALRTVGSSGE